MDFDTVIAPLQRGEFFEKHWNRNFLHIPGRRGRFAGLITWDQINALLEQERFGPPLFKLAQDGRAVEPERYMSPGWGNVPRIDAGRLVSCLAGGATLIMDCMEELSPAIRALSASFQAALHARNYVNLYAGWHGQNGSALHWDSQDIMILQISGRKRWQVFAPTRRHPLQGDIDVAPHPQAPPVWDGVLEDGDVLYLPRGWWHIAHPVHEPSLHLTFGTVLPNGLDLLNWIVLRLRDHEEVRQDIPAMDNPGGHGDRIARLRDLIADCFDETLIDRYWNVWEAQSRARPRIRLPNAPYDQLSALADDDRVRLASSHRLSFSARGRNVEFMANGILYGVPAHLQPALALLNDAEAICVSALSRALANLAESADLKKALSALARVGVALIEKN